MRNLGRKVLYPKIIKMSTENDFSWISNLKEEECNQLMEMIDIPAENVRGVVSLRIALYQSNGYENHYES